MAYDNPHITGQYNPLYTQNNHGFFTAHLEDHRRTCTWLITIVIVSPQDLGLWDPFQNHLFTSV